jgi:hypothetical protein
MVADVARLPASPCGSVAIGRKGKRLNDAIVEGDGPREVLRDAAL